MAIKTIFQNEKKTHNESDNIIKKKKIYIVQILNV